MTGFRRLGEEPVHEGHVWRVVVADFEAPDGERFRRDVVRSPGAVAVVPLLFDTEGAPSVVVVEQYRPAYEREIIEIPAGMRDVADEPAEVTAGRELVEEVGLRAGRLDLLGEILPSPGMTDSVTTLFLATRCEAAERDLHGPEERHMRVVRLPFDEAIAMIDEGRITDAKTVTGLLLASRRLAASDDLGRSVAVPPGAAP